MKKMQKGFTLIELMVVIVIIGILAAVALPKMFGLSAKAKASEIAPSAGQFERLQQAYVAEASQTGSAASVGWSDPSSKYFSFYTGVNGHLAISVGSSLNSDCPAVTQPSAQITTATAGVWATSINSSGLIKRIGSTGNYLALTPNFVGNYSTYK